MLQTLALMLLSPLRAPCGPLARAAPARLVLDTSAPTESLADTTPEDRLALRWRIAQLRSEIVDNQVEIRGLEAKLGGRVKRQGWDALAARARASARAANLRKQGERSEVRVRSLGSSGRTRRFSSSSFSNVPALRDRPADSAAAAARPARLPDLLAFLQRELAKGHTDALVGTARALQQPDSSLVSIGPALVLRAERAERDAPGFTDVVQRHLSALQPVLPNILERFDELDAHLTTIVANADALVPHVDAILKHLDAVLLLADSEVGRQAAPNVLPRLAPHLDAIAPHVDLLRPHLGTSRSRLTYDLGEVDL